MGDVYLQTDVNRALQFLFNQVSQVFWKYLSLKKFSTEATNQDG
jgi:hypothetical protein